MSEPLSASSDLRKYETKMTSTTVYLLGDFKYSDTHRMSAQIYVPFRRRHFQPPKGAIGPEKFAIVLQ